MVVTTMHNEVTALTIDVEQLRQMSARELSILFEDIQTVADITAAFLNQRALRRRDHSDYNLAGKMVDDLREFLDGYQDAVANVARSKTFHATDDQETRIWMLIRHEAHLAGSFDDAEAILAQAPRRVSRRNRVTAPENT